ncbi:MAG TPA: outer membrane protein assembly factor BamA [Steroidobacteraceae bacterium]|nr:outer membrane protein assembly factor BamA [Steroidobacteraceae bacterium]
MRRAAGFLASLTCFTTSVATAQSTNDQAVRSDRSAFVVGDIRIEGLQRITEGTVFNYLPVNIGDSLDSRRIAEAVRALYAADLFRDVEVRRDGNVLIVAVLERPTIETFEVKGNKDIKTEDLEKSLKNVGLSSGKSFDQSVLDEVMQYLTEQYFSRGKYAARIDAKSEELPANKVKVSIDILEGKRARIRQINIVGNTAFSDEELLGELNLQTPNWLSWYKQDDRYAKEALASDLESIRSYYMDRGYAGFAITSSQVSIGPEKDDIFITINVHEGDVYRLSAVTIAGELPLSEQELRAFVSVEAGQTYSQRGITRSIEAMKLRLGLDGYAFANIDAVPRLDDEKKDVALALVLDAGSRAYVRRITFLGTTSVNDNVLRREMRQLEGGYLSNAAVDRSKIRLQRLPFIEKVEAETNPVAGTPDLVDVDFTLKEGLPGQFGAGIGYSDSQSVIVNGNFVHTNVLGTGQRAALELSGGQYSKVYSISHTDPYLTVDGVSRTLELAYRDVRQLTSSYSEFSTETYLSGVSFAYPITELQSLQIGASYQYAELATSFASSEQIQDWVRNNGSPFFEAHGSDFILGTRFGLVELSAGWGRDSRNRVLFPTSGSSHRLSITSTVPGGEGSIAYARATYDLQQYFRFGFVPLLDKVPFSLNVNLGYATAFGNTTAVPPNKHFFTGGPNSVRGFDDYSLGPRDSLGNPFGGDTSLSGQLEAYLPVPEKWASSVRLSAFADFGQSFYLGDTEFTDRAGLETDYRFNLKELRASAGIAVQWLAPLGLFRFSYAVPLRYQRETWREYGDERVPFQFSIGQAF